ncbi:hypothetical protein AB9F36_07430 [Rhizobium leguminosarum]|uniref:hypothetical protein n=1 Tax=Rhizobium leguminosarum TaxID=384 RepID=UPI003F9AF623
MNASSNSRAISPVGSAEEPFLIRSERSLELPFMLLNQIVKFEPVFGHFRAPTFGYGNGKMRLCKGKGTLKFHTARKTLGLR